MSTLKEALQQRRMAEPRVVHSYELAKEPVRSLQIHAWNGEKLVLPWSQFYSAALRSMGEGEQLALWFSKHEVDLQGLRLAVLLPKIASFHLACVWGESVEFQNESDRKEAFINHVSVRCLTDITGRIP
jgi:hypothetical protein